MYTSRSRDMTASASSALLLSSRAPDVFSLLAAIPLLLETRRGVTAAITAPRLLRGSPMSLVRAGGVAIDAAGNLYFSDSDRIRKVEKLCGQYDDFRIHHQRSWWHSASHWGRSRRHDQD